MARYKAYYSIKELSEMSGVDHRPLRYFLKQKGLLRDKMIGDWVIYPHDLRRLTPNFWKGILHMEKLRAKLGM